jgi:hypothetical protein
LHWRLLDLKVNAYRARWDADVSKPLTVYRPDLTRLNAFLYDKVFELAYGRRPRGQGVKRKREEEEAQQPKVKKARMNKKKEEATSVVCIDLVNENQ